MEKKLFCKKCGSEEFYEFDFQGIRLLECMNCGTRHTEDGELLE